MMIETMEGTSLRTRRDPKEQLARTLLLALLPALALIAPRMGLAGVDTKAYPAAICQAAGTAQSLDYWWGQVINRSSADAIADCPIVKDRATGISGEGYAQFWAIDHSDSRDVRCAFYNFDHVTPEPWRTVQWSSAQTSGHRATVQTRRMYWNNDTYIDGSFLFGCSIPGRQYVYDDVGGGGYTHSALVGFKVVEQTMKKISGFDWDW